MFTALGQSEATSSYFGGLLKSIAVEEPTHKMSKHKHHAWVACLMLLLAPRAWAEPTTPRTSISLGFGNGAVGETDGEPSSRGASTTLQLGKSLTDKLELVFEGEYVGFARYARDATYSQQLGTVTLGLRWAPFAAPASSIGAVQYNLAAVHLKAGVGVPHLVRTPYDEWVGGVQQGKWGVAATASVGWMPMQFGNSSLGIEVTGMAMIRDSARYGIASNLLLRTELF